MVTEGVNCQQRVTILILILMKGNQRREGQVNGTKRPHYTLMRRSRWEVAGYTVLRDEEQMGGGNIQY